MKSCNDEHFFFRSRLQELGALENRSEFARKCGLKPQDIQRYTSSNPDNPSVTNLIAIATSFHVSVDWLLGLTDVRLANYSLPLLVEYGAARAAESPASASASCPLCAAKDDLIASQRETIEALKTSVGFTRRGVYPAKRSLS